MEIIVRIAVLGSTGQTGRLVMSHALENGHEVTALSRRPEQVEVSTTGNLRVIWADVTKPGSVEAAVEGADVVVSALGITRKQDPSILVEGAHQVVSAAPRVIWLTSLGMGSTEGALGSINGALLKRILRREWEAKGIADRAVREAGGTTIYAGPLTGKPYQGNGRLIQAGDFTPRMLLPPTAPREGVAALMLAEAETPQFADSDTIALFGRR
ncbi:NAD(P)-dependent oxidoreductase [Streptomyces microflavus]|uniref:NAD(P)-dependent oxidoreductase n=1 Tax=Streptomyces microflavus TaxID=1919 RepID=UPI00382BFF22